jgi:Tfp pilus assembly protein PilO
MELGVAKNIPRLSATKAQYSIFELVLLIAVIVLFSWFILQPKRAELSVQNQQLSQLTAESEKLNFELKTLQNLIATLQNHKQDVLNLDEALPLDGKITKLHLLLQTLIGSTGATLGDLSVSQTSDFIAAGNTALINAPFAAKRSVKRITGSLTLFGNFFQLQEALKKLENNSRIMDILSVDMVGSKDDKLDLKLNFQTYYYE